MKKQISIFLIVVICASALLTFAGCTSATAKNSCRWLNGESYTYNVSLAGKTSVSITTDSATTVEESDFEVVTESGTDQVKPSAVSGTYTYTVSLVEAGVHQVVSHLSLDETYDGDAFTVESLNAMVDAGVAQVVGETVVVTTTIDSLCKFKYQSSDFPPIYSEKTVTGAYVGKERQAVNNYKVTCSYRYEKKNYCDIVFSDFVTASNNFSKTVKLSSTTYDNEMLMLIIRSYDMTSLISAGDTISVMDPIFTQGPASVTLQCAAVNSESSAEINAKRYLSSTFAVDKLNYVVFNASGDLTAYSSLVYFCDDNYSVAIEAVNLKTNALLKFQQGYLVYTLDNAGLVSLGYNPT